MKNRFRIALAAAALVTAASPSLAAASMFDCDRTAATGVRLANPSAPPSSGYLRDASRLLSAAYPGLALHQANGDVYVLDNGVPYAGEVRFSRDQRSGYAALILVYDSRHDAALKRGYEMNGMTCRSSVELVVARMTDGGAPSIVARAPIDDEALAVDIRTINMRQDASGSLQVSLMYFAYYGAAGWFGHVGFRSEVEVEGSRLTTYRLPASYLKLTNPGPRRQEGALGPAGERPGVVRLTAATFESGRYVEIEVPRVGEGSMSGVELLRRIP